MNILNFELVKIPNFSTPVINEANTYIMYTSIGAKLFGKLDYSFKVDEPSTNAKKRDVCVLL